MFIKVDMNMEIFHLMMHSIHFIYNVALETKPAATNFWAGVSD